ncbi:hypothetical protein SPPV_25 [Sheeppox virus]|uniref:Uncharacterized protein n=2 Tax=Sheeppox virus TaxID=10266 RepID=A0A3F2YKI9_SHEVT|nr:hypothetical protein SPPV_25 [Sheeppox virus]AOE46390.1 hypothetical protein SPPV-GH_25 [Sheeppox virus]AOE46552.1 hypothetical protein SPPV-GL_25 [Sheeppox virus]AVI09525.1 hypothetical protein [Sheeppox virus]AVI09659.1 hypothetical protein [Sheeppox virus]QEJ79628.1 Pox_F15 superfamily protein [Sheeppox virus]
MNVNKLDEIIKLSPFRNMDKIKINKDDNCLLGNRCFVKMDTVKHFPTNSVTTSDSVIIKGYRFTLTELLYSPFHFQQPQCQYLLPSFVLKCIDEATKNKTICKYCIINKDDNSLNINIFVPTFDLKYLIIGLRIKHFWSSKFQIE